MRDLSLRPVSAKQSRSVDKSQDLDVGSPKLLTYRSWRIFLVDKFLPVTTLSRMHHGVPGEALPSRNVQ
jgi:hypothetical protein